MKIFIPYLYSDSQELRYSLRSAEKYMPHSGVVICGDKLPEWIQNVEFVFFEDLPGNINKGNNTHGKMIKCLDILGENFIAYNDDYFLLEPWSFENYFSKTLKQIQNDNDWGKVIQNTIDRIGDVASFDVHCPMVFNAEKLRKLNLPEIDYGFCVKTIYAHAYNLPRVEYPDMKIKKCQHPDIIRERIQGRKFFTTYEKIFNEAMIEVMNELYPKKSKYER